MIIEYNRKLFYLRRCHILTEDMEMGLKQLRINKRALILLLISILLSSSVALGSTADIKVTRGGNPAPGVDVFVDGNWVGTTSGNGQVSANVSPGFHTAAAGGVSQGFNVEFDGYAWIEIRL